MQTNGAEGGKVNKVRKFLGDITALMWYTCLSTSFSDALIRTCLAHSTGCRLLYIGQQVHKLITMDVGQRLQERMMNLNNKYFSF